MTMKNAPADADRNAPPLTRRGVLERRRRSPSARRSCTRSATARALKPPAPPLRGAGSARPPARRRRSRASRRSASRRAAASRSTRSRDGSGPPLLLLHGAPLTHYTWRDVAPRARRGVHGRRGGPARLRRQQQAARPARSLELLEARDGSRSSRRHEALRLRSVRGRRPGSRRARRASHGARSSGQGHEGRVHRHRADLLPLHARDDRLRAGVLPLVQLPSRVRRIPRTSCSRSGEARPDARLPSAQAEYQRANGDARRRPRDVRGLSRGRVDRSRSTTRPTSTRRSAAR